MISGIAVDLADDGPYAKTWKEREAEAEGEEVEARGGEKV